MNDWLAANALLRGWQGATNQERYRLRILIVAPRHLPGDWLGHSDPWIYGQEAKRHIERSKMSKWNAEELSMLAAAEQKVDQLGRHGATAKLGQHKHASQLTHTRCDRDDTTNASLAAISLRYRDQLRRSGRRKPN
nr:hypothetical protein [Pseudomarimonas arenosa]